jgi:23S rRNA (pseudouridine1915-N3)-methyltransferase
VGVRGERGAGRGGELILHIVARGKIGRGPEAELVERYLKRIAWPVKTTELGDKAPAPAAPANSVTILLDEKGEQLSSAELAGRLERWRDQGKREARFLIGAADGFGEAERAGADLLIAFGRATWPHLMVRSMLAEQLFRATSILANHPYHREG